VARRPGEPIAALLAAAARASGQRKASVTQRLRAGSFVSARYRYVYVETPKAACTAIKQLIHRIEDVAAPKPSFAWPETRHAMLVHPRRNTPLPSLVSLADADPDACRDALSGRGWLRFCFVRQPHDRLLSAWYNKIWLGEPGYAALRSELMAQIDPELSPLPAKRAHFRAFVDWLLSNPERLVANPHWRPQVALLYPDTIGYDLIGRVESFAADFARVADWLRSAGLEGDPVPPRGNESIGLRCKQAYFDETLAGRVTQAYRADFESFGYRPDDWPQIERHPERVDQPDDLRWEQAIVERNAMLADLLELGRRRRGTSPAAGRTKRRSR